MGHLKAFGSAACAAPCMLWTASAHAQLFLDSSFSKIFPFDPFLLNESFEVLASARDISIAHAISICEGVCTGDSYTNALGAWTTLPDDYSFYFGNVDNYPEFLFDGQIAGTLLPGEAKDFVYGVFTSASTVSPGWYGAINRIQMFSATAERPLLAMAIFP